MKKLYKLKPWYKLIDAATRLDVALGETITVDDVYQLVIEGHIALSWYVRGVPAHKVMKNTNPLFEDSDFSDELVETLDGPFRIKLDSDVKEWILTFLMGANEETINISLDGFSVLDSNETEWQILEYLSSKTDSNRNYAPSYSFPKTEELIIQKQDIDYFEQSINTKNIFNDENLNAKSETAYQNIIAALLDIISEGIPSADIGNKNIGPAINFKSETKLIQAISHHYLGYAGLSKSNLEHKFPAAKRSLKAQ